MTNQAIEMAERFGAEAVDIVECVDVAASFEDYAVVAVDRPNDARFNGWFVSDYDALLAAFTLGWDEEMHERRTNPEHKWRR